MLKTTLFHITIIAIALAAGWHARWQPQQPPEREISTAQVIALTGEMEAVWHQDMPEHDCNSARGVSTCSQW